MRVPIITDLGFGDCGKGTITDSLARHLNASLVVRYNGGAQAAHTVVTPEGLKHTFNQFGSATLAGNVRTLLSRFVLVNPTALGYEALALEKLGVVEPLTRIFIDKEAIITTPYHVAANRLREYDRGECRHGSCGKGIGETVADSISCPSTVIRAGEIKDTELFREKLVQLRRYKQQQLKSIRERLQSLHNLPTIIIEAIELLSSEEELEDTVLHYADVLSHCQVVDGREFLAHRLSSDAIVFEGAQGVLLDQDWGFHPYTTWSTTTSDNARELIAESGVDVQPEVLGVIRAYQTRHGHGPFPTEDRAFGSRMSDPNNPTNYWQGLFRFGWFDAVLANYALQVNQGVDRLAVTCLDDIATTSSPKVAISYQGHQALQIGKKGDLAHQERLTSLLENAQPVWQSMPSHERYAKNLADLLGVKLGMTSFGPRSDQKTILP